MILWFLFPPFPLPFSLSFLFLLLLFHFVFYETVSILWNLIFYLRLRVWKDQGLLITADLHLLRLSYHPELNKKVSALRKRKVNNVKWNIHLFNSPCLYKVEHKLKECKVSLQNENNFFLSSGYKSMVSTNNEITKILLNKTDYKLVVMQNKGSQQSSSNSSF